MKKKTIYCLKRVATKKEISEIYGAIFSLFKNYFPDLFSWLPKKPNSDIWNSQKFHDSIIKARRISKKKFGKIYDTIQLSAPVKKMMTSDKILKLLEDYTGILKENFVCFNSVIRFDPPRDDRNSVDWHFDLYPNSTKINPINGISIVVAFHDIKKKHGSPIFLMNSEKENIKLQLKKLKHNASDNYKIDKKKIKKYKKKIFEINSGDALIFPMKTIHKSGKNISKKVRISGLFRYYPVNEKSFVALKESYTPIE